MARKITTTYWLVAKTKQSSSRDAVKHVRNQGFEYFHPLFRKRAVRGTRAVAALFPYYLLIKVNERKQDWRVLSSTKGISTIIGKARTEEVERIRSLTDNTEDGYYHDPACDHPRFTPGESVEGLRGLFKDKFGTYVGLAGNSAARVRVLFSILGREAEFEVRADDLAHVLAA